MAARPRNSTRIVIVFLAVDALITLLSVGHLLLQGVRWQVLVVLGILLALAGVCVASLVYSRRGRPMLAMRLLAGSILLAVLPIPFLLKDVALVAGLAAMLVALHVARTTLPRKDIGLILVATMAVGLISTLVDLFSPGSSLEVSWLASPIIFTSALVLAAACVATLVRQLKSYPLSTKFAIAFLSITLIPLGISAYFTVEMTRSAVTDLGNQSLLATANFTASSIDRFLSENLEALGKEAQAPSLRAVLSRPQHELFNSPDLLAMRVNLDALSSRDPRFIESVAVLSLDGLNISDTRITGQGGDESETACFETPVRTKQPYVSPVLFGPGPQDALLCFSAPVIDETGEVIGVLRMHYNAEILQELVARNNGLAGPDSFGVLFDEDHFYLAHGTDREMLYRSVARLPSSRLAQLQAAGRLPGRPVEELSTGQVQLRQSLLKARQTPLFTTEGMLSEDRVSQTATVAVHKQPWLVAFFQPQDVLVAPADAQARAVSVLAVVIAGVAVAVALSASRFLAQPIHSLTQTAAQVAAGDLTVKAEVQADDEIGTLAATFNTMTGQLHDLIGGLEQRVAERTRDLERRSLQLQAAAEVGSAAASMYTLDELLPQVTHLVSERFGFYHAGIFLLDSTGEYAVLRAANSPGGERMLARGHRLKVGEVGIVGYVTSKGEPRIALDVGEDAVYFDNPDMPETRSEMALPLRARGKIIGALDVQSRQPGAFSREDVVVLQTLADQVAMAISNATLFQQAQESLEAMQHAYGEASRAGWQEILRRHHVLAYRYDPRGVVPANGDSPPREGGKRRVDAGHQGETTDDVLPELALPIKVRGQVIGKLHAHKPETAGQWTDEEVSLMQTLTEHLSLALESARLYEDTQRRAVQERLTSEVTARMRESLELETVLKTAASEIRQALGLQKIVVRLASPEEQESTQGPAPSA
jgi:GAF domain-containing protein